jgi:stress response protein SCP2
MTTTLTKGGNAQIQTEAIVVRAFHRGANTDLSAILLNKSGKVRNETDFVFYGQPNCPDGSVKCAEKTRLGDKYSHSMNVDLSKVADDVERILLTLTIDPDTVATFSAVKSLQISLCNNSGRELVNFSAEGSSENAFIIAELYRRNGSWKVRHVAQGYNGGLAAIATEFGITIADEEVVDSEQTSTVATVAKISLTKSEQVTAELERKGSRLINLQKAAAISLTKHKVDGITARVIMVLDASGSTSGMWPEIMQGIVDRLATLALNLDDNGELELWVYASGYRQMATVTLTNLDGYIASLQRGGDGSGNTPKPKKGILGGLFNGGIVPGLGYDNNEPPIMQAILDQCKKTDTVPTLILFVTDGGINKGKAIEQLLKEASYYPIFWQFVGLGGSGYGVLQRLDQMQGRYIDNAGFFAVDDYRSIADDELYSRLVKEFPVWLNKAKAKGMLA